MPSQYLQSSDYAAYGVPNTTADQVTKASAIIDGYLDKPDGLIYNVDGSNNPISMATTGQPLTVYTDSGFRGLVMLSYTPVVALLSVQYNSVQGLPPVYKAADGSVFAPDGHLWLSVQVPTRTSILISYIAGWLYAALPSAIKQACANIITVLEDGINTGNAQSLRAGDTEINYAKPLVGLSAYIDVATAAMLAPYKRVFA